MNVISKLNFTLKLFIINGGNQTRDSLMANFRHTTALKKLSKIQAKYTLQVKQVKIP